MPKLEDALISLIGPGDITHKLATVLAYSHDSSPLTYEMIEEVADDDTEDVLLLGWKWKVLIPVRTSRCGEWDDRVVMAGAGETYEIPNISRLLIEEACRTGLWNPRQAISSFFRTNGEAEWEKLPLLVVRMTALSSNSNITATQILSACRVVDLEKRVDTMIAILKGAGVISPKLGSLSQIARYGEPLYEINPCLSKEIHSTKNNQSLEDESPSTRILVS